MKKWLQFYSILLSVTVGTVANAASSPQNMDQIIVVVNSTVITQSELNQAVHKIKKQFIAMHTTVPNDTVLQKQVLDQLINRKLQLDLATQAGIKVSDHDVTLAIQSIATNNHITVDRLYSEVMKQGLTKKEYRDEIRDEYTIHKIQQQSLNGKVHITSEEVDDFMRSATWQSFNGKEYHLEDILITLPDAPTTNQIEAAKTRADQLLQKLHQGIPFQQAAIAESESAQSLQQAGDLGWRKLPEIPSAFSDKLIQAKENDILGPIQTPNGFHILHVAGIRNTAMQGDAAAQRKKVQALLYDRKFEEALQKWITSIHSEAFINMHPEG